MIIGQSKHIYLYLPYLPNIFTCQISGLKNMIPCKKCLIVVPYTSILNTKYIWKKQTFLIIDDTVLTFGRKLLGTL